MATPTFTLIGAGWVARSVWAPLLRDHQVHVAAVVDPAPASREAAQILLPQARVLAEWDDDVLRGCDAAWICSPNVLHTGQALKAMRLGLDVVVEKPVCFSSDEAQVLIDCASQTGRRLRATAASSHRSDVRQLLHLVGSKALGPLICVDVSWRRRSGIPRPGSWFTQRSSAIGGSGADLGWHLLEVALSLLDYPLIETGLWQHAGFYAKDDALVAADWLGDAPRTEGTIDVDTQTFGCLKTASGVLVRLSTAWCSHQEFDETTVTVYGHLGEASLRSTFGFSDNRRPGSHLELRQHGHSTALAPPDEPTDAPYRAFVHSLVSELDRARPIDAMRERAEHRKLRSLSSAMETIYPNPTSDQPLPIAPHSDCNEFRHLRPRREAGSKEGKQESSSV